MTTINIGNPDNPHWIQFEEMHDRIGNHFYFLVKWDEDLEFIMSKSMATSDLTITGVAPYAAREQEDSIAKAIQASYTAAA